MKTLAVTFILGLTFYTIGLIIYGLYYKYKYGKAPKTNYFLMGLVVIIFGLMMYYFGLIKMP
nr:hypothetical protein [Pseudopedobacter sp.]